MKKRIFACAMTVLLLAITSWADDKEKDEDRLKNAATVLTEILNIPDDIPQDLLDKADCVVVFPSVLKAAFVVETGFHDPKSGFSTMTRALVRTASQRRTRIENVWHYRERPIWFARQSLLGCRSGIQPPAHLR